MPKKRRRQSADPPSEPALPEQSPPRARRAGPLGLCLRRWLCLRRLLLVLLLICTVSAVYSWLSYYQAWRQALRKEGFVDEMAAPAAADRVLIIAPHPDDEVLACGGAIQEAVARGAQVDVALMTNGDASELSLLFGEKDLFVSPRAMISVGQARQQESLRALSLLGVPASHVHFLSYPNNGLTALWQPEHWLYLDRYTSPYTRASVSPYRQSFTPQAPYCGQQVLSDLVSLLQQLHPDIIFLPHPEDMHPDHWATSSFVQYALATVIARGGEWAKETEQLGYLVHWPRFPAPARLSLGTELLPPADLAGANARWLRLPLSPGEARRKLAAIRKYGSQLPNFDRFLLKFARSNEVFERLSARSATLGTPVRWTDQEHRNRTLGGADLHALELTVHPDGRVHAELDNGGRVLPKRGYLALDVRGWNERGIPVLAELQYRNRLARATSLTGNVPKRETAKVLPVAHGLAFSFAVPSDMLAKHGLFVSCWGSVKDRLVDSVVTAPLPLEAGE